MFRLGILLLVAAWFAAPAVQALPCNGGAESTNFGEWRTVTPLDAELSADHRRASIGPFAETRYLRVLVEMREVGDGRWHVDIRDREQRVLDTLGPADFAESKILLTARHEVDELIFQLHAGSESRALLSLRQVVIMPKAASGVPYYSRKTPGVEDWHDLYSPLVSTSRRSWGDNVGFMMVGVKEGREPQACSGIALPPYYFMTNWHCGPVKDVAGGDVKTAYWRSSICHRTLIDLSWDDDKVSREFVCDQVLVKDESLDYALLKIKPLERSASISPVRIARDTSVASVSIVHHPAAQQKKISEDCSVIDRDQPSWRGEIPGATFTHDCDSENGSSGAPVFDGAGNLIGLHHLGYEMVGAQCDRKNKAVWIGIILDDLRRKAEAIPLSPEDIANIRRLTAP